MTTSSTDLTDFFLSNTFVSRYAKKVPPFGFNGLGELTYRRTYSRPMENGVNEEWFQTVERVVNGQFTMQKEHIVKHGLGWNEKKAQRSAEETYHRMFHMKFLPPGRGLWAMGSELTRSRRLFAALNNCGFITTKNIDKDPAMPFKFLMDMSMLGVGIGFDVLGANKLLVRAPITHKPRVYVIEDSREGWVGAIEALIEEFLKSDMGLVYYDFSKIREYGLPIKGFGGVASGPKPLQDLIINITRVFSNRVGALITMQDITDIMNMIGVCVVAGNVRRTAEIVFGPYNNEEYLNLKNYEVNPDRAAFGWTSNNSIFADVGMDYTNVCEHVKLNGEPGFAWLQNMQQYGRLSPRDQDYRDHKVAGGNPCLEQSLESAELCCLVETFPNNHDSIEDYCRTLKFAYLYAKTVTLGETHWPETNRVLLRNRRIGCSMSGIAQFLSRRCLEDLRVWCDIGYNALERYDKIYSDWLCIPKSIKMTSIKPSGTVSLLAGATPGMHYPESRFYIRRMRMSAHSELFKSVVKKGYHCEASEHDPRTMVVSIPIDIGHGVRTINEVSMWEQMSLAAFLQEHWADNQVSCTVTFKPDEKDQIKHALNYFQYKLKGISFLPKLEKGAYKQMPYEEITDTTYKILSLQIGGGKLSNRVLEVTDRMEDKFCDGESCDVPVRYCGIDALAAESTLQTLNPLTITVSPPTPIPQDDCDCPQCCQCESCSSKFPILQRSLSID